MLTRGRSFVVFLAITAIAVANCVGPQVVLAAHHVPVSKAESWVEHAAHEHAGHIHAAGGSPHGTATPGEDDPAGSPSKFCCSTMTCTAGAILVMTPTALVQPVAVRTVAAPLEDLLYAFNAAALDPPPRIG
ncbi:MAG: hypothetical protein WD207_00435 [Xanthobacteraceae bacterium]